MSLRKPFFKNKKVRFFLGDIRDKSRLLRAFSEIDIVVHAAALKQVPAAEYNPMEFVKTNIIGAENIIFASINNKVERVISLSTDKAANPINLYGATKLAADKLFIAANNLSRGKPIFSSVRYGNVLGSRGSVVPFFKSYRENKSQSIPITDINMTRFFISLKDSVKFVLNSLNLMKGGEIFVPKMPSINLVDLIKIFENKPKIKLIGLRPGEKLHEVLIAREEINYVNEFKDFFIIKPQIEFYRNLDYSKTKLNEQKIGRKIKTEYNSLDNPNYYNLKSLKKKILVN